MPLTPSRLLSRLQAAFQAVPGRGQDAHLAPDLSRSRPPANDDKILQRWVTFAAAAPLAEASGEHGRRDADSWPLRLLGGVQEV